MPTLTKIITEFSLILKLQTKIAADNILIFYFYLSNKIRLDFSKMCFEKILCEDAPVLQYKILIFFVSTVYLFMVGIYS